MTSNELEHSEPLATDIPDTDLLNTAHSLFARAQAGRANSALRPTGRSPDRHYRETNIYPASTPSKPRPRELPDSRRLWVDLNWRCKFFLRESGCSYVRGLIVS